MTAFADEAALVDSRARTNRYREFVRAYYDRMSTIYEAVWGPSFHFAYFESAMEPSTAMRRTELAIAQRGGFNASMTLLDVGCGIGGPAISIAEQVGASVVGIDLSPVNVATARDRARSAALARVRFEVADAMELPFPNESFSGVYSLESGCHTPDKRAFVAEAVRVLRAGGRLVFSDWLAGENLDARGAALVEQVCRGFALPSLVTLAEMERHVRDAGCTVIECCDLSAAGAIEPNWASLLRAAAFSRPGDVDDIPPCWRFAESGAALCNASRAGAFVVGLIVAEKPPAAVM